MRALDGGPDDLRRPCVRGTRSHVYRVPARTIQVAIALLVSRYKGRAVSPRRRKHRGTFVRDTGNVSCRWRVLVLRVRHESCRCFGRLAKPHPHAAPFGRLILDD